MDLRERWSKFKQELLPIMYVSAVNVWWLYNLPPKFIFRAKLNTTWIFIQSVLNVTGIICAFLLADKLGHLLNQEYLDVIPYGGMFKIIQRVTFITSLAIGMFWVWYTDFYGMSNVSYLLLYVYFITSLALMYRAAHRVPIE